MIKELQSLGLDVRVLDKYNEEIDLKQTFDDDENLGFSMVENENLFQEQTNVNDGLEGYSLEDENGDAILEDTDDYDTDDVAYDDEEENA